MTRLEDVKAGVAVRGITPKRLVRVVGVHWYGDQAIKVVYQGEDGRVGNRLLYRHDEPALKVEQDSRYYWPFDGDGALLRLVSEAMRIRLTHLFDPYLAIHTSRVEPLPHQITAVQGEMLRRQPLRFLLADDPEYAERAKKFSAKVKDVSEFLQEIGMIAERHPLPVAAAYHDACHLAHAQEVRQQPRKTLKQIPGMEVKETTEAEVCCGSAGIYNMVEPEPAAELGERKAKNVLKTGARR